MRSCSRPGISSCNWAVSARPTRHFPACSNTNARTCPSPSWLTTTRRRTSAAAPRSTSPISIPRTGPLCRAPPPPAAAARIRVGYSSGDLRDHAVGQLLVGVLERHDRSRFETFAYSTGYDDGSELRRRLERGFEHFVEAAAWSDRTLAERIASSGIDILVDLGGHGNRFRVLLLQRLNAHTTAIEALGVGVPVLTLRGTGFASRGAAAARRGTEHTVGGRTPAAASIRALRVCRVQVAGRAPGVRPYRTDLAGAESGLRPPASPRRRLAVAAGANNTAFICGTPCRNQSCDRKAWR